jgi:hypothetical protein
MNCFSFPKNRVYDGWIEVMVRCFFTILIDDLVIFMVSGLSFYVMSQKLETEHLIHKAVLKSYEILFLPIMS